MRKTSETRLTNPFVGLRAFEENEDYLFFGRSNQISELLKILSESRFLAVIGSSGSGKSSLVKSGLLPAIYSGFMTVGHNWRAVSMRPGEDPVGYLTKALAREGVLYENVTDNGIPHEWIIEASLRRSEHGLVQVYKEARLPAHENLLIVVDQFEELFRFSRYEKENKVGKSDAIHFIQVLLSAVQQKECPIYVLLTMRADFLGDCAEFRGLPEAINGGQYLIPRMKRDEIREAITGPVAVSSATISQRLLTRLLNDLNNDTDQLPILQHAMMRTWDAWYDRNQHHTPIDFEDYEKIGTMKAALSQHADEAHAELSPGEQHTCELMFKALTDKAADVRGIRRPRSIADLSVLTGRNEAQVKKVVETFRKPGRTFLMPPPHLVLTEHSIIDISHESLMRVWNRLVVWIEEEARSGDIYLRLANSAQLHEQRQRGLLKNPELEIALQWREQNKPSAKWAEGYKANFQQAMLYLAESQKEDLNEKETERKRIRKQKALLIGFLFFLAAVAVSLFVLLASARRSEARAHVAETSALQSKGVAEKERDNAIRLRKKADSSARAAETSATEARLAKTSDSVSRIVAIEQREKATQNAAKALEAQRMAEEATEKQVAANAALLEAHKKALLSISRDYARLIKEGPSEENKNKDSFYRNNYFLLYTHHFANLGNRLAGEYRADYAVLKNKLHYNNDLYRRIYENLLAIDGEEKRTNAKLQAVRPVRSGEGGEEMAKALGGNGLSVVLKKSTGTDSLILHQDNRIVSVDTPRRRGQKFLAYTAAHKRQLVFCSTTDHYIYVYNYRLQKSDTINMGAKVTALDCFDDSKRTILYFGTASGYIGYILYEADKKNQPVFENKLESEITAIQLFMPNDDREKTFLLAAAKESSPRVYKLDGHSLRPDKLLWGNELPYDRKEYGTIQGAWYNRDSNRIVLATQRNGRFLWNPFTEDLLKWLESKRQPNPALAPHLQFYK